MELSVIGDDMGIDIRHEAIPDDFLDEALAARSSYDREDRRNRPKC
jgi:hypothetical protein